MNSVYLIGRIKGLEAKFLLFSADEKGVQLLHQKGVVLKAYTLHHRWGELDFEVLQFEERNSKVLLAVDFQEIVSGDSSACQGRKVQAMGQHVVELSFIEVPGFWLFTDVSSLRDRLLIEAYHVFSVKFEASDLNSGRRMQFRMREKATYAQEGCGFARGFASSSRMRERPATERGVCAEVGPLQKKSLLKLSRAPSIGLLGLLVVGSCRL